MRRFFSAILVAASIAALWSCGGTDLDGPDSGTPQAPAAITLTPSGASVASEASKVSLSVNAPLRPVVSGLPSWIILVDGTFNNYNITFTLEVARNTAYEPRTASLTVTSGSLVSTFTLTQAAAEKPSGPGGDEGGDDGGDTEVNITPTLVTADPTDKAKALYEFILGQYGKKMISSVMADVNWNHTLADRVYTVTGKYPAMNCYDFIHINYSPANWIDYTDLTPVTEWADAGGIVSMMWHFNVPKKQGSEETTCTPGETTFRAKNIFKENTWENKWYYGQMDKVVEVILALQEKGVAAVWRPFHEAAGNATYKQQASWTTAWFWWGYDGADVFRKLWVNMFDYFASKGVKNLIWVWTTQNYNGNPSAYDRDASWYPGDKYVDIVARDLYGSSAADNYEEFSSIQRLYPTKMVALGECGTDVGTNTAFATIPSVWSGGAKWSWFMPWYGDCFPGDSWWKTAMSSTSVLSRSDVKY